MKIDHICCWQHFSSVKGWTYGAAACLCFIQSQLWWLEKFCLHGGPKYNKIKNNYMSLNKLYWVFVSWIFLQKYIFDCSNFIDIRIVMSLESLSPNLNIVVQVANPSTTTIKNTIHYYNFSCHSMKLSYQATYRFYWASTWSKTFIILWYVSARNPLDSSCFNCSHSPRN